jgi:hypothetical protein
LTKRHLKVRAASRSGSGERETGLYVLNQVA